MIGFLRTITALVKNVYKLMPYKFRLLECDMCLMRPNFVLVLAADGLGRGGSVRMPSTSQEPLRLVGGQQDTQVLHEFQTG